MRHTRRWRQRHPREVQKALSNRRQKDYLTSKDTVYPVQPKAGQREEQSRIRVRHITLSGPKIQIKGAKSNG